MTIRRATANVPFTYVEEDLTFPMPRRPSSKPMCLCRLRSDAAQWKKKPAPKAKPAAAPAESPAEARIARFSVRV